MTKRSKRLAKFLENELGWSIRDDFRNCPSCKGRGNGKHCSNCGEKLPKPPVQDIVYKELEAALKYALED